MMAMTRARNAAEFGSMHGAEATLGTGTARVGAHVIGDEIPDDTIFRTIKGIARLSVEKSTTRSTTVLGRDGGTSSGPDAN